VLLLRKSEPTFRKLRVREVCRSHQDTSQSSGIDSLQPQPQAKAINYIPTLPSPSGPTTTELPVLYNLPLNNRDLPSNIPSNLRSHTYLPLPNLPWNLPFWNLPYPFQPTLL